MKPDLTAAELVEKLEALVSEAYHDGALAVHNAWVAGHGQSEPDFGEAASDYAKSLEWTSTILTALRAQSGEGRALYRSFTDWLEAAAQICGSLAETEYDDSDGFEAATGCEAAIMAVVKQQRAEQAALDTRQQENGDAG
jgi:hypothetical protein